MIKPNTQGLLWCLVFVVLDAIQAVYFGSVLQRIDGFLLAGLVFGGTSVVCILWTVLKRYDQIQLVLKNTSTVVKLNITTSGGWLFYLAAVQQIEPAIAFTIFAGSIPFFAILASSVGFSEGQTPRNTFELIGNLILLFGLFLLSYFTIAGLSGFVRGDTKTAIMGVVLSFAAGASITGMLLYGQRLNRFGLNPVTQFGFRFPLFIVLSLFAVLLGLDAKEFVAGADMLLAVTIGLVVLAFPIYAVQKAVSLTSSLTIGALASTAPSIVFVLQLVEGRVEASLFTTFGLLVCFLGAVTGAFGASRVSEEMHLGKS
jgi:drug/metabolite transporter (DMT)-like permease